jgi:prolyl oligopeptidase
MTVSRCALGAAALLASQAMAGLSALSAQSAGSPPRSTAPTTNRPASLVAPVRPVTDDYFGTKVVDPYRYMENLKDTTVSAWMRAQANYTSASLAAVPGREPLLARIRALSQSAPQVDAAPLPGDTYLLLKREATGEVANLYLRRGLTGDDRLLVDPLRVKLAQSIQGKGKNAIQYFAVSHDGKYIAVGIAPGGSERDTELRIFETASGREIGDVMPRAWGGGVSWLPDNRSLIYPKLRKLPAGASATGVEQKVPVYLHVLGRNSDNDPAVFGYGAVPSIPVDSTLYGSVNTPPGSRYALGALNTGVSPNSAYYIESVDSVGKTKTAWRKVADTTDDVADIEVHGADLYVLS